MIKRCVTGSSATWLKGSKDSKTDPCQVPHPKLRNGSPSAQSWGDRALPSPAQDQQSRSRLSGKKKTIEEARGGLKAGEVFYYADEFNLSWFPTLRAMWSPKGQQVMIPTPGQPDKYYGIGAVNYHTGESVVQFHRRKRRQEIAQLLEALLEKHPTGTVYVAWDNASMHEDDEIEAVVRAAAGRLVLLYLPTYSPWLNPIEMLWRHFRREVTHCELFETRQALLEAAQRCFERFNQRPQNILSVIGSKTQKVA